MAKRGKQQILVESITVNTTTEISHLHYNPLAVPWQETALLVECYH